MSQLRFKKPPSAIVGLDGKPLQPNSRAYEASAQGRRLGSFDAPDLSPNQAATSELSMLRRRMRASVRNNPWISRGLKADVANEIGTGIIPRSKATDAKFRKAIRMLWNDMAPLLDADGRLNAYGIQWSAARARRESGEVFVRIRQRRPEDGLLVPVQFQVLESDFCPLTMNEMRPNGNEVINGIEFNKLGKRAAYWMYKKHPADKGGWTYNDLTRVPAEQIIHHFIPLRPGQQRGEPNAVQSIVRSYLYDKYDDAELGRKETRSQYTGVIFRPDYGADDYQFDPISGLPLGTDAGGVPMLDLEPGSFPSLLPGEEIKLFDGDDSGNGYADFQRQQKLAIAAGQDVPYELVTGDYSNINDRVWRAIMNQYRREIEQIQDLFTIQQVCRVMWEAFVDAAVLAGAIEAPGFESRRHDYIRAEHRAPAWPYINPLQDANAARVLKQEGFESRSGIIAERGWDAEDVDEQRAEDDARERRLGLNQKTQRKS